MSHTADIELVIAELDALDRAAQSLGLEFVHGLTQFRYFAGNTETCDHVIRIPNNPHAYEIGVIARGDQGYGLRWDMYAGGGGMVEMVGGREAELLSQAYATEVTANQFEQDGYRVERSVAVDGSIVLEAYR
jgi:hypothetical protein